MKKVGYVSLVGRPNVGKSTLLNNILNINVAITSDKVGTTRNTICGIYNDDNSQIIFVDTPGIHKPQHKLGTMMNKKAYQSSDNVDVILFLVDAYSGFGRGDRFILDKIKEENKPIFLLLNKIDKVKKENLLVMIDQLKEEYSFAEIIPISGLEGINKNELIETIKKYLDEGEVIFNEDELTNVSVRFMMGELVRQQILRLTKEEIPHAVTCYVEEYEETEDIVNISVLVVVERDSMKKILIGKQGSMLKEIGTKARIDMEKFLGKKVFLTTYVKTLKNWRENEIMLNELGLGNDE